MLGIKLTKKEADVLDNYIFRKCCKLKDAGLEDSDCYKALSKTRLRIIKERKTTHTMKPKTTKTATKKVVETTKTVKAVKEFVEKTPTTKTAKIAEETKPVKFIEYDVIKALTADVKVEPSNNVDYVIEASKPRFFFEGVTRTFRLSLDEDAKKFARLYFIVKIAYLINFAKYSNVFGDKITKKRSFIFKLEKRYLEHLNIEELTFLTERAFDKLEIYAHYNKVNMSDIEMTIKALENAFGIDEETKLGMLTEPEREFMRGIVRDLRLAYTNDVFAYSGQQRH